MRSSIETAMKRAFRLIGLRVRVGRSRPRALRLRGDPATAGRRLELVGPSCVGKSTIVDAFVGQARNRWLRRPDIAAIDDDGSSGAAAQDIHAELFKHRLKTIASSAMGARRTMRTCAYFASIIENDLKASRGDLPCGVVFDEGMCQVFAQELLHLSDADFATAMRGRAIVLVGARDPRRVVAQTRERQRATGRIRDVHAGLEDHELAAVVARHAALLARLADRAEAVGTSVLRLEVENGVAENASALERFARSAPAGCARRERSAGDAPVGERAGTGPAPLARPASAPERTSERGAGRA